MILQQNAIASTSESENLPLDRSRLEQALSAVDLGFCVIPMQENIKKPAITYSHFMDGKQPSRATVTEWFTRNPNWNIGVLLGTSSGGSMAVDFDDLQSYQTWAEKKPELANWLPTVRTRDGFHVYFQPVECFHQSHDLRPYGTTGEVKGDKTLTVFPGSVVDGHEYQWVVEPTDGVPPVSLVGSELLPESFVASIPELQPTTKRTAQQAGNGTKIGESQTVTISGVTSKGSQAYHKPVASPSHKRPPHPSNTTSFDVQDFVSKFAVHGEGHRDITHWKMAVCLAGWFGGSANVPADIVDKVHEAWWRANNSVLDHDEEWWRDELSARLARTTAKDGPLMLRLAMNLEDEPVPQWASKAFVAITPKQANLCRMLVRADRVSNGGTFFIGGRDAAKICGYKTQPNASRQLRTLVNLGIVNVIETGGITEDGNKATVYQLAMNPDGSLREAS